jgi:hypothetical protein
VSSKIKHTKLWGVFIIGAAALLLTACGGPETTYSCHGSASSLLVKYTGEDGATVEESVSLPWTQSVTIGGNDLNIDLSATNEGDTGDFTCEIKVDGHSVMTAEGEGGLEISGDYTKSGNTAEANFSSAWFPHEESAVAETAAEEEPAEEEAPTPDPATGLEIINSLDTPFCAVYLAASGASDWGESRLTEAEDFILLPDTSFIIPNIEAQSYDMIIENCEHNIVGLLNKTELGPGMWVEISTYEDDRQITVKNNSSVDVCSFSAGVSEDNRTPNLILADMPLAAGSEKSIVINKGVLTLWVTTCDGVDLEVQNVDLMEHDGYVLDITDDLLAGGQTANIQFVNDTSADICGIFFVDDPSAGWGNNFLVSPVLSGEDFTLTGVPQEVFSYKIESCNSIFLGWGYDIDFAQVVADTGTTDLVMTVSEKSLALIKNNSSLDVCGLYVRRTGETEWYANLLSSGVSINAGQGVGLNIGATTYDFLVESCTGETQDLMAQDVYDGYVWEIAD